MKNLNLTLRESLIIIFPGFLFSSFLLLILINHDSLKTLEHELFITISTILFGGILYSLNLAKKVPCFMKALAINKAKIHFKNDFGVSDFFRFYDSGELSDEHKSKENIYTSLYHMFFNSTVFMFLIVIISVVSEIYRKSVEWKFTILCLLISFLYLINTWLIFRNKVKKSLSITAKCYIKFKEKELGYVQHD